MSGLQRLDTRKNNLTLEIRYNNQKLDNTIAKSNLIRKGILQTIRMNNTARTAMHPQTKMS